VISDLIMKHLFTNFVADYLDSNTRPHAHGNLVRNVEHHLNDLTRTQVQEIIDRAVVFVSKYEKAWPWERFRLVANSLRM
jgi:putative ribosome biogenesis GTPase RsgA